MNIYSIVDHTNIDKIVTLFTSVYINACEKKEDLNFFLITDKIKKENINIPECLIGKIRIKCLIFNDRWKKLLKDFNKYFYRGSTWCKNDMNFGRFLFFQVFPEVDRVVYLDWDMIVYGNIFELDRYYNKTNKMIVADCGQKNLLVSNILIKKYHLNYIKNINLSGNQTIKILGYLNINPNILKKVNGFNSGFYIVSRHHFEDNYLYNLIRKLVIVQRKFYCFNFGTQVIMNLMHVNKRFFINRYWNYMPHNNSTENIKIIHWNGKLKPWNNDVYLKHIWEEFYNKTINSENLKVDSIDTSGNITFQEKDENLNVDTSGNITFQEKNKAIEI